MKLDPKETKQVETIVRRLKKDKRQWLFYEDFIYNHLRSVYPTANIQKGVKIRGIVSDRSRQVDILIDFPNSGIDISIAVDCKYFNRKVDIKAVESFIGFLQDIKASKGILITNEGYTSTAEKRALKADRDIELRIIDFATLKLFQGFGGIVLTANKCSALFDCPKGWIIDKPNDNFTAVYPYGLTFARANELNEWIALRLFFKSKSTPNITSLINVIQETAKHKYPNVKYDSLSPIVPHKYKELETQLVVCEFRPMRLEYSYYLDCHSVILNPILYVPRSKNEQYFNIFKELIVNLEIFGATKALPDLTIDQSEQYVKHIVFI